MSDSQSIPEITPPNEFIDPAQEGIPFGTPEGDPSDATIEDNPIVPTGDEPLPVPGRRSPKD